MQYKIYKKSKSAMQSGIKNTKKWCIEIMDIKERTVSSTFGWNSSTNTSDQIKIYFDKLDNAITFAKKNNLNFKVFKPNEKNKIIKSYSENFKPKKL
jgi:hypothetical protein